MFQFLFFGDGQKRKTYRNNEKIKISKQTKTKQLKHTKQTKEKITNIDNNKSLKINSLSVFLFY